jgi:hypothetical protein
VIAASLEAISSGRRPTSWCDHAAHGRARRLSDLSSPQTSLNVVIYNTDGFIVSAAPARSGNLGIYLVLAGVVSCRQSGVMRCVRVCTWKPAPCTAQESLLTASLARTGTFATGSAACHIDMMSVLVWNDRHIASLGPI